MHIAAIFFLYLWISLNPNSHVFSSRQDNLDISRSIFNDRIDRHIPGVDDINLEGTFR
jgi:hypothetical protein